MPVPSRAARSAATSASSVNFEELLHTLDHEISVIAPSLVERFRFDLNGMTFDVRRIAHDGGHRFLITVNLGYLPFSIESTERRDAIQTIVQATQALPTVHFTIDHASKITAGGLFDISSLSAPDSVFYPLTLFLQEARPFMQIIGQYL